MARPFVAKRENRAASHELSGDAIEDLGLLVVLLLFLLGSREVGAKHGVLGLLLHAVLLLFLLLGGGEISAEHGVVGLLLHTVLLLFLLLGGRQVVPLLDAVADRGRERRQAHRSEEAERDGDCSNLAHCVCPLGSIH